MANNEKQKWEKVEQTHIIENETKRKFGSHVESRNTLISMNHVNEFKCACQVTYRYEAHTQTHKLITTI